MSENFENEIRRKMSCIFAFCVLIVMVQIISLVVLAGVMDAAIHAAAAP